MSYKQMEMAQFIRFDGDQSLESTNQLSSENGVPLAVFQHAIAVSLNGFAWLSETSPDLKIEKFRATPGCLITIIKARPHTWETIWVDLALKIGNEVSRSWSLTEVHEWFEGYYFANADQELLFKARVMGDISLFQAATQGYAIIGMGDSKWLLEAPYLARVRGKA